MSEIQDVPVRLPIRLGQFLKLSGLVDSGAAATEAIAGGAVEVDARPETRRGRQLAGGEVVSVHGSGAVVRARVVAEGSAPDDAAAPPARPAFPRAVRLRGSWRGGPGE